MLSNGSAASGPSLPTGLPLRRTRIAAAVLLSLFGSIGGLVVLEAGSSFVLFILRLCSYQAPAFNERLHTAYDPELGWVNRPNVFAPDLYGPGVLLKTNAQGFRSDHEITPAAPRGRLRVICSGDSFTLGYGVDNDRAWCQSLEAIDPRFEAVNMGQGGYGVDQAYLWYARDGARLEHAVHVFALITGDFYRMRHTVFAGHGKPVLAVENGKLVTRNVPVPRGTARFPFLRRRLGIAIGELRAPQLLKRIRQSWAATAAENEETRFDEGTWEVASKVFETLNAMNRGRGAALVVVHLPTGDDYTSDESDPWRERLRAAAERDGFSYVDLIPEFRELSLRRMTSLFIPKGSPGTGHYSPAGHDWVAERVHERLIGVPAIRALLERLSTTKPELN